MLRPAIKLPDQTPVRGIGTATKQASARYLWNEDLLFNDALLMAYFWKKLEWRQKAVCFFIFLPTNITKKEGIKEPKKDKIIANAGESALLPQIAVFIPNGKAIFVSNVGIIDTIITVKHTLEENNSEKKVAIFSIQ